MNLIASHHSSNGFALIEVLVALGIVALALPALMFRMQSIANTTEFIETRTVAHWVAENRMQELMADHVLRSGAVRARRDQDTVEYDNQEWFWRVEIEELELGALLGSSRMYRVVVDVGLSEDETLASITGFLGE